MPKIVFIGTSITKGVGYGGVTANNAFPALIGASSGYASVDVINKGVSSDTSSGILSRLATDVLDLSPSVCAVEVGINDWQTGVPLATFCSNVRSIFAQLRSAGIKTVGITPSMQRGSTESFLSFQPYLNAFEECTETHVVDVYREMALSYLYYTPSQFNALYADVVHLTPVGHRFVANMAARPVHASAFYPS